MGHVGLIKSITSKKWKSAQDLYHVVESNAKHWQWALASWSQSLKGTGNNMVIMNHIQSVDRKDKLYVTLMVWSLGHGHMIL